jgi:hypothetical protein
MLIFVVITKMKRGSDMFICLEAAAAVEIKRPSAGKTEAKGKRLNGTVFLTEQGSIIEKVFEATMGDQYLLKPGDVVDLTIKIKAYAIS